MEMANEPLTATAKPMAVTWAVRLMFSSLGLSWIKAAVTVASFQAGSKAVLVLVLIGGGAVTLFLIAQLAKGKNFVRWLFLLALLVGLPTLLPVYRLELRQSPGLFCLSALAFSAQLIAVCLLFTAKANAWFKVMKEQAN